MLGYWRSFLRENLPAMQNCVPEFPETGAQESDNVKQPRRPLEG